MGSTLERHPFSGLVHSAGELLHRESEECDSQLFIIDRSNDQTENFVEKIKPEDG